MCSSYQDGAAERLVLLCWTGLWQHLGRCHPSASSVCQSSYQSGRWSLGNSGGLRLWKDEPKSILTFKIKALTTAICEMNHAKIKCPVVILKLHFCPSYLIVIIFLGMTAESSFCIMLRFSPDWNVSELMKKIGCFTWGNICLSRGNIQVSRATPHLV